jgi:hypothetical protein
MNAALPKRRNGHFGGGGDRDCQQGQEAMRVCASYALWSARYVRSDNFGSTFGLTERQGEEHAIFHPA